MQRFPAAVCLLLATSAWADETPGAFTSLLDRASRVQSVAMTLDAVDARGTPSRIMVTLDSQGRLAYAQYASPDGKVFARAPERFIYSDGERTRATRNGRDHFIETDAEDLWRTTPPRAALYAPWAMLPALVEHARTREHAFGTNAGLSTLTSTAFGYTLEASDDGHLARARVDVGDTRWSLEFVDASPVPVGDATISLPAKIVEREWTGDAETVTTWTVTTLEVNPGDAEERLRFDANALDAKLWDPLTGKITNAEGRQVGMEEIPAARAVETWEVTTKASAWIAVWKWGSIAAGLGLVAFAFDMVRRRL